MAVKPRKIRLKVLKMLSMRQHRYGVLRFLSMSFSLAVLAVVPLSGLARVDLWRGHHEVLFKPAPLKHAMAGVIVGIASMYVLAFLSNIVAGRLFCGWGCPVGQVSRFGERLDTPGLKARDKFRAQVIGAAFSVAFVTSVLAWWVDLRMLIEGSPMELSIGWGLIVLGVAGAYLHARYWSWGFCKSACPIGWYYSFIAPASYFGIHFRNEQKSCIECDACDHVCPVDLKPRELAEAVTDRRGISVADAPGFNHCLECGDCIDACERMIELRTPENFPQLVPLRMGYFSGPQRIDADDAQEPTIDSE